MIIGLTGEIGAGKSAVRDILPFPSFSCSDILREDLKKDGKKITRNALRDRADRLRADFGEGILGERAAKKIEKEGLNDAVVDSIRNPGEVLALRHAFGDDFIMVGIRADIKLRYERVLKRKQYLEELAPSFLEFTKMDEFDRTIGIDDCLKLCDVIIENDGDLLDLEKKLKQELLPL